MKVSVSHIKQFNGRFLNLKIKLKEIGDCLDHLSVSSQNNFTFIKFQIDLNSEALKRQKLNTMWISTILTYNTFKLSDLLHYNREAVGVKHLSNMENILNTGSQRE